MAAKVADASELVRCARPQVVVECGTAIGYSGLWITRELKASGQGRLITIEIDPGLAARAEANFRWAGLADVVSVRVGDAGTIVREITEPIGFALIDCDAPNYIRCFEGMEANLATGAIVVADNVGVSARSAAGYLDLVRSRHESRTEWFDVNLPWRARDAMEITTVKR